jgi:hypothetical protein
MSTTVTQAMAFLNTLYNGNSTPPTSGEEDWIVWLSLFNIAINVWESEEGMLWRQLFVKLSDAADGDKTATAGDYSYAVPTNFSQPASAFVWIGTGTNKTVYRVIDQKDLPLYETDDENWCYFLMDTTPTLEFNPNCTVQAGTINYVYYKTATVVTTGASTFEMADPMFAVYYALNELKKDEGDMTAGGVASQKLEAMRTKNFMETENQIDSLLSGDNGI